MIHFQSNNKRKEMSGIPELDYFMNVERSDVRFIVEGQSIPALKAFLSVKSRVFHAMFSGDFRESKDKEIVIEDTTYEAFKTFIQFLYCDHLVLKDVNDFKLIRELYRLSDRYDVSRLEYRITDRKLEDWGFITSISSYCPYQYVADEEFQIKWPTIKSIARIAFELKITKLEENVMKFIDHNFDHFLKKDNKELNDLHNLTDGRIIELMANKCKIEVKKPSKS